MRTRVDAVERAERLLQDGESIQRAHGGSFGTLCNGDGIAQSPEASQFPGNAGQLPRSARHSVVDHNRIERVVRRVGAMEGQAQLGEPGADFAFH